MLRHASTAFDAIAHPVRRQLLECLLDDPGPATITSLAARIEVSRSTASRHLALLRAGGLVEAARHRRATVHRLRLPPFARLGEWVWAFTRDEP